MNILKNKKFIFYFVVLFLINADFCSAEDKKFFDNKEMQTIVKDPFYLFHDKKTDEFPMDVDEFSFQKSILVEDQDYSSEIESLVFCPETIKEISLCELTRAFQASVHNKKMGRIYLQQEKLDKYLEEIAQKINTEPVNGKIEVNTEGKVRVLALSKNGLELDIEESRENIKNSLINSPGEKYISLKAKVIEPEIKSDQIADMGIVEMIGQGESNFAGSPRNRIHNIRTAVSKFHGLILEKGEEFSFVKYLGEVDGEHGYLPELVIKKNTTVPEFGGGICQVSTTMFRAAINTGLEITARTNHAYPVQYYSPQGTDATVYIPNPDLKFINNTPAKILIQGKIEGTKLYFQLYGTSDSRKIVLDGPYVTERNSKNQMKTVWYQKVYDVNGNEIINDTFRSFYDDPAKYHHETASAILTEKPDDWSDKEWKKYKEAHGM